MSFAEELRRRKAGGSGTRSSFAERFSPSIAFQVNRRQKEERIQKALLEVEKYQKEAEKYQGRADFFEEIGRAAVRPAISFAEIPKLVATKGREGFGKVNVPGLGGVESYQEDFRGVQEDIIEGRKPLYSALAPMGEAVLDTASLGLSSNIIKSGAKVATKKQLEKGALKRFGIEGGIYGFGYGGVAVAENPEMTPTEKLKTLGFSTLIGAASAVGLSFLTSAVAKGVSRVYSKYKSKPKTSFNPDEALEVMEEIETTTKKELSETEQENIISSMSSGAKKEDFVEALSEELKQAPAMKQIADTQDPVKISSLLKDKIAKEDIPALSRALKHINDPDQVARLLDKYNPDTINNKLVDDLALADTAQQVKALLKGKASKEVIEEVAPILKTLDDPKAIADIIEEFQISLKKVSSDIEEIKVAPKVDVPEPTVKTVEPEVKETPKAKDPLLEEAKPLIQEAKKVEPWQFTKKEYSDKAALKVSGQSVSKTRKIAETYHYLQVLKAIREGKKVPTEVLKDYPKAKSQLTAKWNKANPPQAKTTQKTQPAKETKNEYAKLKENVEKKKESQYAKDVQKKAIERGILDKMEDVAEMTPNQRKEQARLSAEVLVDSDRTLRILRGVEPLPEGLLAEGFTKNLENHILTLDDISLARELTRGLIQGPLAARVSGTGSALSMRVGVSENSPVEAMKDIIEARMAKKEKKIARRKEKLVNDLDFKIQDAEFILKSLIC